MHKDAKTVDFILNRIVELQSKSIIRKITDSQREYEFIENCIDSTKPDIHQSNHHYLIQTPFRYPLPIALPYAARFRPPFSFKNCFYGCKKYSTTVYEYATHWLMQRIHVKGLSQTPQTRTHFTVSFKDKKCIDIRKHDDIEKIMNRRDHSASHAFVSELKNISSILYPSCRDPRQGKCIVTFDIKTLGKAPLTEQTIEITYDENEKSCTIESTMGLKQTRTVYWKDVC